MLGNPLANIFLDSISDLSKTWTKGTWDGVENCKNLRLGWKLEVLWLYYIYITQVLKLLAFLLTNMPRNLAFQFYCDGFILKSINTAIFHLCWNATETFMFKVLFAFFLFFFANLDVLQEIDFGLFLFDRLLWVKNWHMIIVMSLCLGKDLLAFVDLQSAGDAFTETSTSAQLYIHNCKIWGITNDLLKIWIDSNLSIFYPYLERL